VIESVSLDDVSRSMINHVIAFLMFFNTNREEFRLAPKNLIEEPNLLNFPTLINI
jgi:hypothetical protein